MAKFRLNRKGMRELLRSDPVKDMLVDKGAKVALAAGEADHELTVYRGRNRWRATVATTTPQAAIAERKYHRLLQAIHAAGRP